MDAVLDRYAGIDIGKKLAVACLIMAEPAKKPQVEIRSFGTTAASWLPWRLGFRAAGALT